MRIREPFTPLPCPRKPRTTLQVEGCWEQTILRTDTKVSLQDRVVLSLLAPAGRRAFTTAERAWLAYRKSRCDAASSPFRGGTIEPVVFGHCIADANERHLADISALENGLRDQG